jgi:predicted Zn-dependent protease with MMP-like domain
MKRAEFEALVESALRRIPRRFRDAMQNLGIIVEDWPDPDVVEDATGDREEVLYGLFTGRPLTERRYDDWGELPSIIHIYQKPLEEDFPNRDELEREIEITLAHEIAHYLGIDEETLDRYGYG